MASPKTTIVSVLLALTLVINIWAQKADVETGLDCTKDKAGKVIACKGKNNVLTESEKKINTYIKNHTDEFQTKMTGLTTRFGATGGSGSRPGAPPQPGTPQYCRAGACKTSVNQIYTPSLLYNVNGDARFVMQLPSFSQYVFLAVCEEENAPCAQKTTCQQKHFSFTLLVWDPYFPEAGLYVESFEIPSGCCCSGAAGDVYGGSVH